jgi:hypothetical protein
MEKDVKVEPVKHYGINLYHCYAKFISTAPQINGLCLLDRAAESTEFTQIDESCLLAVKTTGYVSRQDGEKQML